jgi:hypothetical protein
MTSARAGQDIYLVATQGWQKVLHCKKILFTFDDQAPL